MREYTTRLATLCRQLRPNATTFFNARITPNVHRELDVLTQLEIESLTTGGWGYLFFPTWSRLVRTYPRPVQGMTARFHKSWADFGGLKTVPQLDYETATIMAAGGVVNIGDQLHPRGTLDRGAYQVIGEGISPRRGSGTLLPGCGAIGGHRGPAAAGGGGGGPHPQRRHDHRRRRPRL